MGGSEGETEDGPVEISVLHVDDEPEIPSLTREFLALEDERFDVESTTDPTTVLERLAEGDFDCVVSDYEMPEMNGVELLRAVRAEYPSLPFVLFTGKGSEEVASEAIAAGVTDYLRKGTGPERYALLANRLSNAVESYRRRQRADALARIRTIVRDVNQALVRASSRAEIDDRICEIVSAAEPYQLAVICDVSESGDRIEPRAACGPGESEVEAIALTDGQASGDRPIETAVRQDRVTVSESIHDGAPFAWDDLATAHGWEAVAAAPLTYDGTNHGVLVVCADRWNAFDERERNLIAELADDVGHAFDALRARRELEERRNRHAALFENTPDPVIEVSFEDGTAIIENVNSGFESTFGFQAEAVLGRRVDEVVVPDSERDEHESLKEQVFQGDAVEEVVTRQTASGTREFVLRIIPLDVTDISSGAFAWYTDITERRERERELRRAKERFQKIFEHGNDAIMVVDLDQARFIEVNPAACEMLGYDRETLLTQPPDSIHPPSVDDAHEEFLQQVRSEGTAWTDELECVTNEGEIIPTEISGARLDLDPEESGPDAMVAILRDISEREQYRESLERQVEQLDQFARIVSHDLRNPLQVAAGRIKLAREDAGGDHLDEVERALDRMDEIIDRTLTLAQSGRAVGESEAVDLADLVDACWENVATGDLTLQVEDLPTVQADPERLRHVVENLFKNALDHGGTTVRIGALPDGFYVGDDGPGIPPDEREQIFEPGYTTSEEGTGFGLAIVKHVVEAHGWEITVTESDGGGARFEVTGVSEGGGSRANPGQD